MKQFMYALATLGLHQVVMKNRGPEQARIEESRELAKEATSQRKIFMKLTGMRRFRRAASWPLHQLLTEDAQEERP